MRGRAGAGSRFKSSPEAPPAHPHRNPPGFPPAISRLQAEGKVLAADPCMVGWALLGASWPEALHRAPQPPGPPSAARLGPRRGCGANSSSNHCQPLPASPACIIQRLWGWGTLAGGGGQPPIRSACLQTFPLPRAAVGVDRTQMNLGSPHPCSPLLSARGSLASHRTPHRSVPD